MKPLVQQAPNVPSPGDVPDTTPEGDKGPATGPFKKPDLSSLIPPDVKETVDRVVAAGMKLMYSPEMRDDFKAAVDSQDPMPKKLSENITGLMLLLDQKSQGGIPQAAIFPAAMELLGDAADALTQAGQEVSQDDYNHAALMMFAAIGQKLGGKPDDLMGAAAQSLQGDNPDPGAPPAGAAPAQAAMPGAMPPVA